MKILVFGKSDASQFTWGQLWAAISISSPVNQHPILNSENRVGLLQMFFHDAEFERPELEKEHFFNSEHAQQILDFVKKHKNQVDLFLVHCEAGSSRSPAVAAALEKLDSGNDNIFFKRYTPNMAIYRCLLETGMQRNEILD